ncbi:tRNA modification GTPase [Vibrio crassostreae]|nr:tRNA modification GTPase [Vibrio crassostreae]
MREGMKVVIAGRPNAGKSSLLNALSGKDSAIVTDIAGTTRDVLREHIHIDGMPLHIIDTAGLREASDEVEKIGIERAWEEITQADRVLFMVDGTTTDATDPKDIWPDFVDRLPNNIGMTVIRNKADQTGEDLGICHVNDPTLIRLSAKTGQGVDALRNHLKDCMGFAGGNEGGFMARRRHLDALERASEHLDIGQQQLEGYMAGEILAEELRITQQHLNEITGEFSSDDLLGRIFTSFCIGK